jgi:D-3-phosphoglycerate dehydrogenase / 2-oxoglutarate reductase
MRVLIADKMARQVVPQLNALGCSVTIEPDLSGDALVTAIQSHDPQVLVVRSTKVLEKHLAVARSLSLVVRAGAGVNTIAVEQASERGIYVANCPGKNAAAVAELALGHMLNADRRIADNVAALRDGQWKKKTFAKGTRGLKGRTLGLIGMGNIGTEVAQRAQAFDMNVVAWDISLTPDRAAQLGITQVDGPVKVAQAADILSVHIALNEHTKGLISDAVLSALKPGSIFINTSRGPVVDEAALAKAVTENNIKCGLDVFCDEPSAEGDWSTPLTQLHGVYGTHHIGASTEEAAEAVGDEVSRIITAWKNTGSVPNCVNLAQGSLATHLLVVRHKDEVGVLAGVLTALRKGDINVQEMQNIVFQGATAACAHIQVSHAPTTTLLGEIQAHEFIFAVDVVKLENP